MSEPPNPNPYREPDEYLSVVLADLIEQYGTLNVLTVLGVTAPQVPVYATTAAPNTTGTSGTATIHPPAHTRSRAGDPDTSRAAARSLDPDRLGPVYRRILTILGVSEGLTDEDLHGRWTGPIVSMSGLRTRRAELVDAGLVRDSGRRETLRSGRQGIVWVIV